MATKQQKIEIARALYITGKNDTEIATILEVSKKTIQNYKTQDSTNGNDWDLLRAQKHISQETNRREYLYSDFVGYMHDTLREIREADDLSSSQKADKIVKLSDAFSKMKHIVRHEDPEAFKRGIIKHVIEIIGKTIAAGKNKELLEAFIQAVDECGEDLDVSL